MTPVEELAAALDQVLGWTDRGEPLPDIPADVARPYAYAVGYLTGAVQLYLTRVEAR